MRTYLSVLENSSLLHGLSAEGRKHFLEKGHVRRFLANQVVFFEDDPAEDFYIVLEGVVVMLKQHENGQVRAIKYCQAGECIALVAVMRNISYPLTAQAESDCVLLAWHGRDFRHEIALHPVLGLNAMEIVASKFIHLQELYMDVNNLSVEQRIAKALLHLQQQGGQLAEIRISRQRLAEMTSTTIYSVSRTIAAWEKLGWLSSRRNQVVILQRVALEGFAKSNA